MKRYRASIHELEGDDEPIHCCRSVDDLYIKARRELERAKDLEEFDYTYDRIASTEIHANSSNPFFTDSECDKGIKREVLHRLDEDVRSGAIAKPSSFTTPRGLDYHF